MSRFFRSGPLQLFVIALLAILGILLDSVHARHADLGWLSPLGRLCYVLFSFSVLVAFVTHVPGRFRVHLSGTVRLWSTRTLAVMSLLLLITAARTLVVAGATGAYWLPIMISCFGCVIAYVLYGFSIPPDYTSFSRQLYRMSYAALALWGLFGMMVLAALLVWARQIILTTL